MDEFDLILDDFNAQMYTEKIRIVSLCFSSRKSIIYVLVQCQLDGFN